jgi:chitin disaccharide deacetylase
LPLSSREQVAPARGTTARERIGLSAKARVVLCADDFGLTEGVSRAILALAESGRVSATSAMTNCPGWAAAAPALRALDGRIGVGLHLNLTAGRPVGAMAAFAPNRVFPRHREVLTRALTRRLPLAEIEGEVERQLDAFAAALGRAPDFIDGHQHVHVLPGVRGALVEVLKRRRLQSVWLRDPAESVAAILDRRIAAGKALFVDALALGFGRFAGGAGFDTNEGFSGYRSFERPTDLAAVFEASFARLGPRPVVMCHPAHPDRELGSFDPIPQSRAEEFAYLGSERFGELLAERRVELVSRPLTRAVS